MKVFKMAFMNPMIGSDGFVSIVQNAEIKLNVLYKSEMQVEGIYYGDDTHGAVEKGLHAFVDMDAVERSDYLYDVILAAEIPKGATFYIGKHGEIVSNRMKYKAVLMEKKK